MADCTWRGWLSFVFPYGSQSLRRRVPHLQCVRIEGLEERLVLSNTAPVATPAEVVTFEDKPLNGQLAGADVDADTLTFKAGPLAPAHGTRVINEDGTFTYIPAINFHGTDSFSFIVNDGALDSPAAVIMITVISVNDIPTVDDGFANPDEDLAFPGSVVSFVNDADGDTLTYSAVTTTTHGTLTLNTDGTFTYTPAANYNGPDSFTFRANDGQVNSEIATFNLTVNPVDDALKLTFPSATATVPKTSSPVRIDPAASVVDIDSVLNYANTQIRTTISSGNSKGDTSFGRVSLVLQSQGFGPGLVEVKGSKVYFDGGITPIATISGGTLGRALVIKFTKAATEQAVNAVLKQISLQASKKAITGTRTMSMTISVGKSTAIGTRMATIS